MATAYNKNFFIFTYPNPCRAQQLKDTYYFLFIKNQFKRLSRRKWLESGSPELSCRFSCFPAEEKRSLGGGAIGATPIFTS